MYHVSLYRTLYVDFNTFTTMGSIGKIGWVPPVGPIVVNVLNPIRPTKFDRDDLLVSENSTTFDKKIIFSLLKSVIFFPTNVCIG